MSTFRFSKPLRRTVFSGFIALWIALAAGSPPPATASESPRYVVSVQTRDVAPSEQRNWRGSAIHQFHITIWYPSSRAQPGQSPAPLFDTALLGTGAPPARSASGFPLVMLSHGTGGAAAGLAWIGSALAQRGYIVVGVNHPGNNAIQPLTVQGFGLWWERATDVSDALSWVLSDPAFGPAIERARIGAVGFSLGGYTVLALSGAITDRPHFDAFCSSSQADAICDPPEFPHLSTTFRRECALDALCRSSLALAAKSYRDDRIRAAFAIAPALGEAFTADGLSPIGIPVAIVAGTEDITVPLETNAERFVNLNRKIALTLIPGANHYSFVNNCGTVTGDPSRVVCTDPPNRTQLHADVVEAADHFFARALQRQGAR